jgi:ATP synthase subunit 6
MILNLKNILLSPLEQFEILPVFSLYLGNLDFSITNETIILFVIFFFVYLFKRSIVNQSDSTLLIVPSRWQLILEGIYKMVLSMVVNNIGMIRGQSFFPLIFSIFFYVLCLNIVGLVPYSFTLTSHFIVTFALSLALFIGINIICIRTHGIEFFSLFLPSGTSVVLAFLLVPIELISYIFKPISLSIRLFANMMGGHTLLKVVAGFSWSLMSCSGILFIFHYVPMLILIPLFGLEVAVALIQAFVFSVLNCIYLNDAINLH